jgi:hypothetical protein
VDGLRATKKVNGMPRIGRPPLFLQTAVVACCPLTIRHSTPSGLAVRPKDEAMEDCSLPTLRPLASQHRPGYIKSRARRTWNFLQPWDVQLPAARMTYRNLPQWPTEA